MPAPAPFSQFYLLHWLQDKASIVVGFVDVVPQASTAHAVFRGSVCRCYFMWNVEGHTERSGLDIIS